VSTYVTLGSRVGSKNTGQVAQDKTGFNPGNWTVAFSPNDLNVNVPYFEVAHIVVNGQAGSSFSVYIDSIQWDANQNGFLNSWDPSVPLPLRPGQWLYFYWSNTVASGNPPSLVIWLRYDIDIPANRAAS